jgi:hypothetical protein
VKRTAGLLAVIVVTSIAVLAPQSAASGRPAVEVSTGSFSGDGLAFTFNGTFTLDHFAAVTPADVGQLPELIVPRLVAVGTTTAQVYGALGNLILSVTDAPMAWVNVSVSGSCSAVNVALGALNGGDYMTLHGQLLYPNLPLPPWGSSVHWGSGPSAVTITGSSGLVCAAARVAGAGGSPTALATVLNQLLRGAV